MKIGRLQVDTKSPPIELSQDRIPIQTRPSNTIGQVDGPYQYDATTEPTYPQVRPVKWLTSVPRTKFTQGALYEIGSALSFFQIRHYSAEFSAAAEGKLVAPPVTQDESVAV
jgi:restriction system protein